MHIGDDIEDGGLAVSVGVTIYIEVILEAPSTFQKLSHNEMSRCSP